MPFGVDYGSPSSGVPWQFIHEFMSEGVEYTFAPPGTGLAVITDVTAASSLVVPGDYVSVTHASNTSEPCIVVPMVITDVLGVPAPWSYGDFEGWFALTPGLEYSVFCVGAFTGGVFCTVSGLYFP